MSSGINLVVTKNRSVFAPIFDRIKTLRLLAVVLLFGVSVSSMILFLLIALSPLPTLKKQESTSLFTLAQFHTDMARLALLNERVENISKIIEKRTDYNKVIDELRNKLPSDSTITGLDIGKKTVSVTVTSQSLASIDAFLSSVIADTGINKSFTHANLNTLSLDPARGTYLLTLDLTTL